ncbi:HMA2 domain-containing protein [Campylobacter mucosalis]|uniref:HMA2 domain-containing protein n=1 Tax=Campylobacter mucosalis TaxID=202 RepID=UPI00147038C6|nr:hypothetical protein [Campylobacter mucosalis]
MSITPEILTKVASYFTTISHTPGRLRVRVSPKIKELSDTTDLSKLDETIAKINGIKEVKFNKIIGSVTIQYDSEIFTKNLWDDLLGGKNLDHLANKINAVARSIA